MCVAYVHIFVCMYGYMCMGLCVWYCVCTDVSRVSIHMCHFGHVCAVCACMCVRLCVHLQLCLCFLGG